MINEVFYWESFDKFGPNGMVFSNIEFKKNFGSCLKGERYELCYWDYEEGWLTFFLKKDDKAPTVEVKVKLVPNY